MAVQRFWQPSRNLFHSLGRNRPSGLLPRLHLRNYVKTALVPGFNKNYLAKGGKGIRQMYLNDRLGCCVPTGLWHLRNVIQGNANRTIEIATDQQIIHDYGTMGGYKPSDPNTDQGCDEHTALQVLMQQGYADGQKILGYVSVNPQDKNEYCWAMETFCNLLLGLELGKDYVNVDQGFLWGLEQPDPRLGHCVMAMADDDPRGLRVGTWALDGLFEHDAIKYMMATRFGGEMWCVITEELLDLATQRDPNNVDWKTLVADFDQLGGTVPMPIDPTPPAPPAPSPSPVIDWGQLITVIITLLKNLGPQAEPILIQVLESMKLPAWVVMILEAIIHQFLGKRGFVRYNVED